MKKISKGKIIIYLIITILISISIVYMNKENINVVLSKRIRAENNSNDIISYEIIDNKDINDIKILVKIICENNIEYIECPDGRKIYVKNRNNLALDYDVQVEKEYEFRIKEIGKEEVKKEIKYNFIKDITINLTQAVSRDYTKSTITIEILYAGEITLAKVGTKELTLPTPTIQDGKNKYIMTVETENNGSFNVYAKGIEEVYATNIIEVTEISEDMDIHNLEELKAFRDRTTLGATYAGRTVNLVADIDVNEGKWIKNTDNTYTFATDATQWVPIGGNSVYFQGIFNGNHHIISGVYINSNSYDCIGFFSRCGGNSIIKDLIMNDIYVNCIKNTAWVGGMVGLSQGKIIDCGIKNGVISCTNQTAGTAFFWNQVGGIAGNVKEITGCFNGANVSNSSNRTYGFTETGGLVGHGGIIKNCYNRGSISGSGVYNSVGGIMGYSENVSISNTYNYGKITGTGSYCYVGGIIGLSGTTTIDNSYFLNNVTYQRYTNDNGSAVAVGKMTENELKNSLSLLGNAFKADYTETNENAEKTSVNNGYPILTWQ